MAAKKKAEPKKSAVVKVAERKIEAKRVATKRVEGAEDRIIAILGAFGVPLMRSELTQRMTMWTRESREAAIAALERRRKIKITPANVGRRGRPGHFIELAA